MGMAERWGEGGGEGEWVVAVTQRVVVGEIGRREVPRGSECVC